MNALFQIAILFAAGCCICGMLVALVRLFIGPSAQDRVLAFDACYINGMLLLLILGMKTATTFYFDMALLIALFGFIGTTSLAKFLWRGEVIEP
jgi:multicomponent K+:H+ antiporter subunit F